MKRNRACIAVCLALVCGLSGCASSKTVREQGAGEAIRVRAGPSDAGIRLLFDTIPDDVNRVFVTFMPVENTVETGRESFTDIQHEALATLKQTKTLACPFVRDGQTYRINAVFSTAPGEYPWTTLEATAHGGMYLANTPALLGDSERSTVAFTTMPAFSCAVQYAPNKYRYSVTVKYADNASYAYTEQTNAGESDFSAIAPDFQKEGIDLHGAYPSYVTAFCNILNDAVPWTVAVATSETFETVF
jgi:hypothetical protein